MSFTFPLTVTSDMTPHNFEWTGKFAGALWWSMSLIYLLPWARVRTELPVRRLVWTKVAMVKKERSGTILNMLHFGGRANRTAERWGWRRGGEGNWGLIYERSQSLYEPYRGNSKHKGFEMETISVCFRNSLLKVINLRDRSITWRCEIDRNWIIQCHVDY